MFCLLEVRQGRTWNGEITRKQDGYVHSILLAAAFTCAVKSHRSRSKEQTPPNLWFFKEQLQSLSCPEAQYKRFAGIASSVQWDCNMIFQSWVKVRGTLCGAPADCSVPSPIITQGLANRGECLMGFYVRYSDTQKETAGISLSCQWLHMRGLIFTLILTEKTPLLSCLQPYNLGIKRERQ